jgi:hypothetical protein
MMMVCPGCTAEAAWPNEPACSPADEVLACNCKAAAAAVAAEADTAGSTMP